jgi:hypothetical protein
MFALCPVRQYVLNNSYDTVEVEGSARLSAVRWTVAGRLNEQLAKPARQTGEFFILPDKACEMHRSVSEFTNSNKECALSLIVRD